MNGSVVLLISGPPCSGKSMLARRLAQRLRWPVLAKDDFKERLFDALGTGDEEWSARLSRAAFELQFGVALEFVRAGLPLLLEGNFDAAAHARPVERLSRAGASLMQVACRAAPEVLAARRARRAREASRHPGHLDALALTHVTEPARYAPLPIEPTIIYDTTADPGDVPDFGRHPPGAGGG